ncbi:LAFE_0H04104g1_1 [Lachancea fermentati]|uniref:Chitin synthase export chaperone n=1 Tax=Lachancea fermentati TaxID=4955 RepID=A0A1G4MJH1_LACFM|nr:LAFE_0H04104g1_1 [Lachancea fermentati]
MGFGDFAAICSKTPLPLCSVIKSSKHLLLSTDTRIDDFNPQDLKVGILPQCYARSIDVANTVVFEVGNAFVNIGALGVILFMIYSTRQKYTAIGRSEYGFFFELCLVLIVFTLIVDCGVSSPGSGSYSYFVAVQIGLAGACCWGMSVLGLLGFRIWEDGTRRAMLLMRGISLVGFIINFLVAIFTFRNWHSSSSTSTNTMALFVVMYLLNAIIVFFFIMCELVVSLFIIGNPWAAGSTLLGVFFFIVGQVLTYAFSTTICNGVKHYIDGLFFGSMCNLFALMMVYKTWDMTTDDDLEFSVSVNADNEVMYYSDGKF